jgi:hypothetical protein
VCQILNFGKAVVIEIELLQLGAGVEPLNDLDVVLSQAQALR